MRQIWIPRPGPPEVLELREAPDPAPAAGQVRIRVEAAGVNFADIMGRMGMYPDLPRMPVVVGYEVAGRIDAVGPGVTEDWIGADVLALTRFGGYSDVICVPEAQVFVRPDGMDAAQGAAFPVNYLTAWQLISVMGSLHAGESMLVHSAGGGVGIAATQIAKKTRREGDRNRFRRQARRAAQARRRPLHRLHARGFRDARARDHARPRRRADPRRGRRRFLQEELARARADGAARHVRALGGRHRQAAQLARLRCAPRSRCRGSSSRRSR